MPTMTSRRRLVRAGLLIAVFGPIQSRVLASPGLTPVFEITIRRDKNLPTTLGINDCVTGKLYLSRPDATSFGPGFCETLELPYRNELNSISCVAPGTYTGFVKTGPTVDGKGLGWRIQLNNTIQTGIQVHVGNCPENTHGCILIGKGPQISPCCISRSKEMMAALRFMYGTDNSRQIEVSIV